jgi:hypothetical protein
MHLYNYLETDLKDYEKFKSGVGYLKLKNDVFPHLNIPPSMYILHSSKVMIIYCVVNYKVKYIEEPQGADSSGTESDSELQGNNILVLCYKQPFNFD